MNGIKEDCKCGHDKASHHWEWSDVHKAKVSYDCLCRGCECKRYKEPKR